MSNDTNTKPRPPTDDQPQAGKLTAKVVPNAPGSVDGPGKTSISDTGGGKDIGAKQAATKETETRAPAAKETVIVGSSKAGVISKVTPDVARPATEIAALQLLQLEAEVRQAGTQRELAVVIANGARMLVHGRHAMVIEVRRNRACAVIAISELSSVDRNTPLIGWIERVATRLVAENSAGASREFKFSAYSNEADRDGSTYPFDHALWIPILHRNGSLLGGVLFARETPWREGEITIAKRLGGTISHAWLALSVSRTDRWLAKLDRRRLAIGGAASVLISLFPVSLTTLAPLEIAPSQAFMVTAPIDGVIEEITVTPNMRLREGQLLVQLADTVLRNKLSIAEREVAVADARLKKTMQQAFTDIRGRHELGIARTELQLKRAERDYAAELLGRTKLKSVKSGIAVFGDPRDLLGKPVATGEKIMEIADPERVEIRIDVTVADGALLQPGSRVKAFLDSNPFQPLEAQLIRADYQARVREGNLLSFRAVAEFTDAGITPPRLGLRGTAQVYGPTVPLVYYLLRRPLAVARQWTGI